MTRKTSKDWKTSAQSEISGDIAEMKKELVRSVMSIDTQMDKIFDESQREEVDADEVVYLLKELKELFIELSHDSLDNAHTAAKLTDKRRLLKGKEPVGYSKPDAGVTTDAYYGNKSMNRVFGREIGWPLDLSEWDKETASQSGPPSDPEFELVKAEGTKKYTRNIGGRTVHLVIDERGMSPI